jgi:hypothetical protein
MLLKKYSTEKIIPYIGILIGLFFAQISFSQEHQHDMKSMTKQINCSSTGLDCANAATPFISTDGQLWLVWTAGGQVSLAKSKDLSKTFSSPISLAQHGKYLDTGGDARPQIIVDDMGRVVVSYAFFKDTNWNAQINTVQSKDGGISFALPKSIVQDTSSQRFPVMLLQNGKDIFIAWIDKRLVLQSKQSSDPLLGGSIAYGWLNLEGVIPNNEKIANPHSCECCRIGAALTKDQLPIIDYRAIFDGGIRDHATQIIEKNNSPGKIQRIANDGWKTDICPHQGPSIAVSADGTTHVTWYTQGSNLNGLFYANSKNNGVYTSIRKIGEDNLNPSRAYLLALDHQVWLVWKEFDGQTARIFGQLSNDDGKTWTTKQLLSQTNGYSDHPLLTSYQKKVYLSWLTRNDGYLLKELNLQ